MDQVLKIIYIFSSIPAAISAFLLINHYKKVGKQKPKKLTDSVRIKKGKHKGKTGVLLSKKPPFWVVSLESGEEILVPFPFVEKTTKWSLVEIILFLLLSGIFLFVFVGLIISIIIMIILIIFGFGGLLDLIFPPQRKRRS